MELMIGFECPRCHRIIRHQLRLIRPGEPHLCSGCNNTAATLTDTTLREFSANLRRYCEPPSAP